ncbi:xanthine dehydrogenase accessory protein XdhC [Terrarubrum flagellatum]|uniref:xanthine dehydrogenase accessory protein XdhC n=1 Tax=Terrirubrum flagellatum TaxID=2895980 RepID=UPI0031454351
MKPLAPFLAEKLKRRERVMMIRIDEAVGSTPREAGATMLVTANDALGSIGGGQLEFHAIDVAREMMATGESERAIDLPLGPHLGQCCGGRVLVHLRIADEADVAALARADEAELARDAEALIFGAGHTGRALARMLALLPSQTRLIDDRDGVFDDLPASISCERLDDPEDAIRSASPHAAYVILTHSHALDYRLADAALRRGDAAYVGMIGSKTKRARFEKWFIQRGGTRAALKRLTCPIGGGDVRDKRPEIIAALTAADIVRAVHLSRASAEGDMNGRAA